MTESLEQARSTVQFKEKGAKGFESEYGHTFSRTGRTNRAEKFLRATASKNVLGLNPNFVFELSDS